MVNWELSTTQWAVVVIAAALGSGFVFNPTAYGAGQSLGYVVVFYFVAVFVNAVRRADAGGSTSADSGSADN